MTNGSRLHTLEKRERRKKAPYALRRVRGELFQKTLLPAENYAETEGSPIARIIQVDAQERELSPHGTLLDPLEINHDDLSAFQNGFVRCHWHEELEFSVVRRGRVRYVLANGAFELQSGQGVLLNANAPHSFVPADSGVAELLTLIVHPAFLYGMAGSAIESTIFRPFLSDRSLSAVPLEAQEAQALLTIDALAQKCAFAWELKTKELLCGVFYGLLCRSRPALSPQRARSEEALERLDRMLRRLHEHYGEPLDLAALARAACLSRESCCRFFRRMTGQTLSQYLEQYRISRAAALLQREEQSITAVALQCGFGNAGRFAKAFARHLHCTPRQYRSLCRK